ncbi:hypothetical protein JQ600_08560 [Bradyrhizobium sp. AUGA SZCCT0176]|nr:MULTISPECIES: hypothetical protein [unclassified Bradyrhizobium]MBR1224967.1 hypothetical protein [Bradyrhizobium sp. AUGA SZCCT0176]MBR1301425.1 hypothetical protein [Bradyrhizobium sp. AUGA SZCCT0042]
MNVSEQQSEATSGETGSVGAGPAAPDMTAAKVPVTAAIESPMLAPDQQETSPKPDAPKVEAPRVEASKLEATKVEPAKVEAATSEAPKVETPRIPGKLLIMSPGERAWNGDEADVKPEAVAADGVSGKRRMSAMAAVVALATVAGALGGALATAGLGQMMAGNSAVANNNSALEASVARIDADILALKASVEHTSKTGVSQFNKTSDRLDKVEKAQAEPTAKLAKLSDAVEKLRAQAAAPAPVAAATPAAARDVTGTVSPPATAAAVPLPAPKPEIARLPTVDGWVLRDAANGSALIEGRQGIFEVYAGDPVPGLGRIDAIRKQDGKWVVVTSKGLIVAR